jgi:hypothetical protein
MEAPPVATIKRNVGEGPRKSEARLFTNALQKSAGNVLTLYSEMILLPTMKKLLSLLIAFVFLNVESQAYYPAYGGLGLNPVGTYGGTLIPDGSTATSGNVAATDSIGLFSIGVPQVGLATGSVAVFIQGGAYIGQFVGYVDPSSQTLSGILSGASTFQVALPSGVDSNGNTVYQNYSIILSGNMVATFSQGIQATGLGETVNLSGTATIISFLFVSSKTGAPEPTANQTFIVSGTQQSGSVQPTTITLSSNSSGGS